MNCARCKRAEVTLGPKQITICKAQWLAYFRTANHKFDRFGAYKHDQFSRLIASIGVIAWSDNGVHPHLSPSSG